MMTRLGNVARRRSFAASRSFERFSFAAFISFGALVRSCLIWVGTNLTGGWAIAEDNQGALNRGIFWSSGTKAEYFGAELLFRMSVRNARL